MVWRENTGPYRGRAIAEGETDSMKQRIRLGGAIAGLALLATTGCTVSGLPWGDVKVTPDKSQFPLSGPVPNVQIADPQQYQGSIKNGTDTYVEVQTCNSHYGVTCRDGDVVYVFDNYIYLGYAYVWDGYWWTVPIGGGKSYDYYNHTYVDWTMVDASQINIEQNISSANQFIDQHVEVYNQTSPSTDASAVQATSPKPGDPAASPSPGSSTRPSPTGVSTPTPTPTPGATPTPSPGGTASPSAVTPHAVPSPTPTKGNVSGATLTLSGCTSGTLQVSGVSSAAQLSVRLSSSSATLYSSSKASSDGGGSSWTKSLSGLDLGKPTERTISVSAVIDEWSDTLSVTVPTKCLASTPTPSATPSMRSTPSSSYSSSRPSSAYSSRSSTRSSSSSTR